LRVELHQALLVIILKENDNKKLDWKELLK
jgi:hypothetical protein